MLVKIHKQSTYEYKYFISQTWWSVEPYQLPLQYQEIYSGPFPDSKG